MDRIEVLHVDDDPAFAELVATYLAREDDRLGVETAADASEGLERLDDDVDCVVSDYDMPGENGIEFLEAVRAEDRELPFILFTGKGSEAVASEAIAAGVTDYIQKGTREEQYEILANKIANAVEQHRSKRQLRERERELEAERQRLAALFERFPEPVFTYEYDGDEPVILSVNDGFEETFGFDAETATGTPVDDLIVPPELQEEAKAVDERVRGGEPVDEVLRRLTDDGEGYFKFRNIEMPVADGPDGYAVYIDITERVERERRLERSQKLFRTLSATFPDYVFVYDEDGVYLDVILGWRQKNLRSRSELVGSPVDELLPAETAERIHDTIDAALATGDIQTVEYGIRTTDEMRWFEAHAMAIEGGYDGSPAVLLAAHDVTERREKSRALRRQSERVEEIADLVSQDLLSPLRVAAGDLDLAREECDSDHLDTVADALDRMDRHVEDVLSLARQGSDDVDTPADLEATVGDAWSVTGADRDGAALVVEGSLGTVEASRLPRLLENLFRNAVEHGSTSPRENEDAVEHGSTSPPASEDAVEHASTGQSDAGGDGSVTVTVGRLEDGFYVEDDGPGIPEGEREDVFEAGYSTSPEGAGFGLRIVEQVATEHGWTVDLTEGSQGGARVEVTGVEFAEDPT